jgi:hypothetical protein
MQGISAALWEFGQQRSKSPMLAGGLIPSFNVDLLLVIKFDAMSLTRLESVFRD